MRRVTGIRLLALAVLLLLVAASAACVPTRAADVRRVRRGFIVRIGIAAPLEKGRIVSGHGVARAVQLAVSQANESGSLAQAGVRLETVLGDDQDDRRKGLAVANRFVSDPELVAVVGHLDSAVSMQAAAVYNGNDVVAISPASSDPLLTAQGFRNVFRVCATDSAQGWGAANVAFRAMGRRRAYVVDDSSTYGVELADQFAKQFEKDGGTFLGRDKTEQSDTDFRRVVANVKAQRPDIVYYGGSYFTASLLSRQLFDAGVTVPVMGGDRIGVPQYAELAGPPAAEQDAHTSVTVPLNELPGATTFAAAYHAAYPDERVQPYDAYAYDAANVIIEGIRRVAEELGPERITSDEGKKRLIADVLSTNLRGVTGKLGFDQYGDTENQRIATYIVKDGVWRLYGDR